tara:strand:+ start:1395 stop:1838 length:444 start_codon:yes stop_codon:yes gene_type:complete
LSKIASIALFLICSPVAMAEDPQFTFLDENQPAPFAGTLFNPSATAELIVLPDHLRREFQIELKYELDLQAADFNLQLQNSNIRYESLKEEYRLTEESLRQQNTALEEALKQQSPSRNGLWFAAGTATGVVIVTGIAYAIISASASK